MAAEVIWQKNLPMLELRLEERDVFIPAVCQSGGRGRWPSFFVSAKKSKPRR